MKGVSDTLLGAEKRTTRNHFSESALRQRKAQQEAQEKIRAFQRADAMVSAARRAGMREAERIAKADARAAEQAARVKIQAAQRVAVEERRIQAEHLRGAIVKGGAKGLSMLDAAKRAHGNDAQRAVLAGARTPEEQKAALLRVKEMRQIDGAIKAGVKEVERVEEKAAKDKVRAYKDADREIASAREAGLREAETVAKEETRIAQQAAAAEAKAHADAVKRREKFAHTIMGAGGKAVRGAVGVVGAAGGMALNAAGGFSPTDAIQQRLALRGELADIANRGYIANDPDNNRRRNVDELQGAVNKVGLKYGIAPEKGAAGLDKFASKTGKLNVGLDMLGGLAEMSRAGAGDLDDLADAAGDVFNADTTQNAEQVLAVMRALAAQGKIGAVEMKDLAAQMAKLGAAAGRFQGDAGKNMAMMGGLAQLARQSGGAASAQQATTSVQSLTNQFYKNARLGHFKELGVQVKDEKTGFNRDLDQILIETMQAAERKSRKGGHGMQDFDVIMGGAIADAQARRATLPLEKAYKTAGGGEAGTKAVQDLLKQFAGASMTKEDVTEAANARLAQADVQLEQAMMRLKNEAADKLTPSLMKIANRAVDLIPIFGRFLDVVSRVVDFFAENPFSGFAGLVTAFFLKELAAAQISSLIQSVISKAAGGGGGGLPGGGVGGAGGAAGGSGLLAGGLIAAGTVGQAAILGKIADTANTGINEGEQRAASLTKMAESGDVAGAKKGLEDAKQGSGFADMFLAALNATARGASALTGGGIVGRLASDAVTEKVTGKQSDDLTQIQKLMSDREVATNEKLIAAIQANTAAQRDAAASGGAGKPTDPNNPARNGPRGGGR